MKLQIENFEIECFETEQDLKFFLDIHKNETVANRFIYVGDLYKVPRDISTQFKEDITVQIKKRNFNDVQSIIIIKK